MSGNPFDGLSLFEGFTAAQRALLRPLFISSHEPTGTVLFEQGDPAEFLYIITEGEINIRYKPEDGPMINVARVRPEGVVGWSAALGSPTYTSAAVCMADCQMLRVRSQDLRHLCERNPETAALLLERLAALIAERLRNTHNHVIALLEQGLQIRMNKVITTR
ncbi:MAG: cyclic nucleotide-binding domain-containing protein [Anaerolineales bacterium]|nr:cyclic nucleotide-binding domain-containing protein [Anaerolineales bacterium]